MRLLLMPVALVPLILSGCVGTDPAAEPAPTGDLPDEEEDSAPEASLLFVQEAANGTSMRLSETNHTALVLQGVHNRTQWFTDRPIRDAGVLSTAAFLQAWSKGVDSFEEDPPNGALVAHTPDGEAQVFALEFLAFRYDEPNATLVYTVQPFASGAFLASHAEAKSALELPEELREVSLFIDDMDEAQPCLPQASSWECNTCTGLCSGNPYFGGYYSCTPTGGGMWKCGGCSQWLYANQDRTGIPCVDTRSTYDCEPQGGGMWKCGGCSQWVYVNSDRSGTPCNVSEGTYDCDPVGGSWKCSGCREWLYSAHDVTGTPCPYRPGIG